MLKGKLSGQDVGCPKSRKGSDDWQEKKKAPDRATSSAGSSRLIRANWADRSLVRPRFKGVQIQSVTNTSTTRAQRFVEDRLNNSRAPVLNRYEKARQER